MSDVPSQSPTCEAAPAGGLLPPMSDAPLQGSRSFEPAPARGRRLPRGYAAFHSTPASEVAPAHGRRLPRGYGLLLGAVVSIGLWAGIIWAVAAALG